MFMGAMPSATRQGLMFVLSSPSGAGKSTLTRMLLERDPSFVLSVSATTRAPREGEVDGKHYFFVDHAEFDRMLEGDEMLEHAEVFGNRYGTPGKPVAEAIGQGRDVLFDVDWQGASQLRASQLSQALVTVFILPPSMRELERRLRTRAQDSDEVIARRMEKSRIEVSHWEDYDYVLINDDLATCYSQIETLIAAERLRRIRQPGLAQHVDTLNKEFDALIG
ncbi:MAG: guanylate kinase [Pseudomonadota bacterium]